MWRSLPLVLVLACAPPPPAPPPPRASPAASPPASPPARPYAPHPLSPEAHAALTAFDHQDFDTAKAHAANVLAVSPGDPRMLRLVITIACIEGDEATARQRYAQLQAAEDRDQLHTRCTRYGIELGDR